MLKNVEVLIVEDSPTQAMVLDDMLRGHGVTSAVAPNALDALARLKERLPALVIADAGMPGVDGAELCRRIKADPRTRGVPVMLLTPLAGPEDVLRAVECGADCFFAKPYDERALLARIEYILANAELRAGKPADAAVEVALGRERRVLTPGRAQTLDLLFAAYETVAQRDRELRAAKDSLRETARKLEHMHAVAMALGHCESADAAYHLIVQAAADTLSSSQCLLSVVEGESLVVKASSQPLTISVARAGAYDSALAWETCRNSRTIAHGAARAWLSRDGFASVISAPVDGFGVLQAVSRESDAFTAEDARLLDLLLAGAADAVRRIGLQERLADQTVRDALTGLYNRHALDDMLDTEMKRSRRYGHTLAVLMVDVDKFKEINELHGQLAGDWALKAVAAHLHAQVRVMDSVFRYAGDEFVVLMPESNPAGAEIVRRRILDEFAKRNLRCVGLEFPVAISAGVACWPPDGKLTADELLSAAAQAMLQDKKSK